MKNIKIFITSITSLQIFTNFLFKFYHLSLDPNNKIFHTQFHLKLTPSISLSNPNTLSMCLQCINWIQLPILWVQLPILCLQCPHPCAPILCIYSYMPPMPILCIYSLTCGKMLGI